MNHVRNSETALPMRYLLVTLLFILSSVAYLDRTNISIAGIQIGHEYAMDNTRLGWVFSAFLIGYAVFQLPAALLAHRSADAAKGRTGIAGRRGEERQ